MSIKIYLIEPIISKEIDDLMVNSKNFNSKKYAIWEPYTAECIGGFLKENIPSLNIEVIQDDISDYDLILSNLIFDCDINIVCISAYSHAIEYARILFSKIKKENKDIITICGGYHPSGDPEIKNDKNIDFCISGEGEIAIFNIINFLIDNKCISSIKKLDYEKNYSNMKKEYSWPLRYEKFLKRAKAFPLAYPTPSNQINPAIITYSRGCIYNCSFCASSLIWGDRITYRDASDVIGEIKYLKSTFKTNYLYWSDLALNNNNDKLYELLDELNDINDVYSTGFVNQNLDKKTANKLYDAGFRKLFFGIEALNKDRLEDIKYFQTLKQVKKALSNSNDVGIINKGYVMIAFPDQKPEDSYEILDNIKDLDIDELNLNFYTPFLGTKTYFENKDNISRDYYRYTGEFSIFNNHVLEEEKWIKTRENILDEFYKSKNYINRVNNKIKQFPQLKDSFEFFFNELKSK